MKLVGDAVRDGQFLIKDGNNKMSRGLKLLGLANWGYVKNNFDLINDKLPSSKKPYQTIFWKETLVSGDGNYQAKDKSKTILCSSPLELAVHPGSPRG